MHISNILSFDHQVQLAEKHIIKMPVVSSNQQDQFMNLLEVAISTEIDSIVEEHMNKYQIPYCTFGVDRRLLSEVGTIDMKSLSNVMRTIIFF